jgi:hypothetical protein
MVKAKTILFKMFQNPFDAFCASVALALNVIRKPAMAAGLTIFIIYKNARQ